MKADEIAALYNMNASELFSLYSLNTLLTSYERWCDTALHLTAPVHRPTQKRSFFNKSFKST